MKPQVVEVGTEIKDPPTGHAHLEIESAFEAFAEQQRIDNIQKGSQTERQKDQRIQSLIEGGVVFVLTEFLLFGLALWSVPLLVLVGAVTGWVAHTVNAQRGMAALIAFDGLCLARVMAGQVFSYYAIIYFIIGICLFVAVRIPRESERIGW